MEAKKNKVSIIPEKAKLSIKEPTNIVANKENLFKLQDNKTTMEKGQILQTLGNNFKIENSFIQPSLNKSNSKLISVTQQNTINQENLTNSIQQNEGVLREIDNRLDISKIDKQMQKALIALKPAFQNVQETLKFQAEMMRKDKDFDSEHVTVPVTQSLLKMTINQIGALPVWRN